ncbi:alpha-L-arabinofuranosidase domain protein (plasmid) [Gemmatirosa kalamazoonensis]|uniref:non-reducing end alpha-L-arabinofuranosidase n=1 Tax=Gemmatirosa kalamazoonensis TaxID=861299 RepID=W0RPK1_9BACT|nr:alpha-L-arabinofuranosidase C-terminal domain-containing protein [Gemmatirosa kalamazoonensis]AHG92651.1 alpha-L-arabinofuranosidase domain protein [Gemmatirosa kalamazoonensis]
MRARLLALLACLGAAVAAHAQTPTQLVLNADQGRDTISRHIYGQFAEHLGRLIYDGVWTRRDSTQPWRMRDDVVQALKRIQVPNIRWPGGCFADTYHWRDGIGPREQRPSIVNTNWGGVTEDNGIGTHEYLALAKALGAEPYLVGNLGSGTVQEMHDWWEYVNHPGHSPMADLRRKNGQDAPFEVRFWGMGNESWGCGGNMRPEYYADELKRYASFLPGYGRVRPFRIAVGPSDADYNWTEVVMRDAGRMIDGIDMHHYTLAGSWANKGSATQFDEGQWFRSMRGAMATDEMVTRHSAIMDRYDPRKRVALIVGEWGTWHDPEPGSHPGFLYQQNTMRDAVVAAASLDIFNRHADRVRGANIAQMVNVLQAMILTQGSQMLLTPTYHVFEFYTVHHDALLLPIAVTSREWYKLGTDSVPAVSASASRDRNGVMHVTMSNLDPSHAHTVTLDVRGARVSGVSGRILTAPTMNAYNTFEHPDAVKPAPFTGAQVADGRLTVALPAHAVVVLELK